MESPSTQAAPEQVSVVIPVYQGERTLGALLREIAPLTQAHQTPAGRWFRVSEVVLVHDGARDGSAQVIEEFALRHPWVRPVWLSRNYGQHPATLAGMASTSGAWVATMDEDGQQNPADLAAFVDAALDRGAQLVYAKPLNPPPHGWLRNALSFMAKWTSQHLLGNRSVGQFNSFRLVEGEVARSLAAYCGNSVFLDIALAWVVGKTAYCPVTLRQEGNRRSGYSLSRLMGHFWRLILSSGTRPLRFITLLGALSIFIAIALTIYALTVKWLNQVPVQGWTSTIIVTSFFSGMILFSLGVIAEYLAVALNIVMGRPLYLVVSRPPKKPSPKKV